MSTTHPLSARASQMFALIESYLASSLTQEAFCVQNALPYSTFQFWLRKYRDFNDSPPRTSARNGFVPLRLSAPTFAIPPLECSLEYPNGVPLHLSGPIDSHLLSQLIQAQGQ